MKWILKLVFVLFLLPVCVARADHHLDTSFLKQEPYRKTKQKVDLSSIKSERDLAVIKNAINPIMRFMVGVSFAELPPFLPQALMTEHGRQVLRRAPLRNELKRYSVAEMREWKVCGNKTVSLHATFSDLLGKNLWREKYLFIETADGWRFDDHKESEC